MHNTKKREERFKINQDDLKEEIQNEIKKIDNMIQLDENKDVIRKKIDELEKKLKIYLNQEL